MSSTISKTYKLSTFTTGALQKAHALIRNECRGKDWTTSIVATFQHPDGVQQQKELRSGDLETISAIEPPLEQLRFSFYKGYEQKRCVQFIRFPRFDANRFNISATCDTVADSTKVHELLLASLHLLTAEDTSVAGSADDKAHQDALLPPVGKPELAIPSKVTVSWLYHHPTLRLWAWAIGILVSAFAAGVRLGSSELFMSAWKQVFE